MQPLARDTSPQTQEMLFTMLGKAPPAKKLALTFQLIQSARLLILSGLHRRYPHLSKFEIRHRLIAKLLAREHVIRAYGFDPDTLE